MADARLIELRGSVQAVQRRIESAAASSSRDPRDITLVVVTKFFGAEDIVRLSELGITHIAENRDQEAGEKVASLPEAVREQMVVHFVGQLQSNKARSVSRYADVVQSVDRAKVVDALDTAVQRAATEGRRAAAPLPVTIQVDLDRESGGTSRRGGARTPEVPDLATRIAASAHLRLVGLMAVAPLGLSEQRTTQAFTELARISADLRADHPAATWISAGMSADLEQAVAAGATHLRVGSAILGSRPAQR